MVWSIAALSDRRSMESHQASIPDRSRIEWEDEMERDDRLEGKLTHRNRPFAIGSVSDPAGGLFEQAFRDGAEMDFVEAEPAGHGLGPPKDPWVP
jgi:hypothetical protein